MDRVHLRCFGDEKGYVITTVLLALSIPRPNEMDYVMSNNHKMSRKRKVQETDCESDSGASSPLEPDGEEAKLAPVKFKAVAKKYVKTCVLCTLEFGKTTSKEQNPGMILLNTLYHENKESMSQEELAKLLAHHFAEDVEAEAMKHGIKDAPHCEEKEILHHLRYCLSIDLRSTVLSNIRDITIVATEMKNCIFKKNAKTGETTIDYVAYAAWINALKNGREMYAFIK